MALPSVSRRTSSTPCKRKSAGRAKPTFYEFFAGGGMARGGLGEAWTCLFANDIDPKKAAAYMDNWGGGDFLLDDVANVRAAQLPGRADLVWSSFPCQDLSLAGGRAGLRGGRSGAFHAFWTVVTDLIADGRAPKLIALENVCGLLTSRGGADFRTICRTLSDAGYRCGALVVDAALFVPQSRPRLFMIGVRGDVAVAPGLLAAGPTTPHHTRGLCDAVDRLPRRAKAAWLWWKLATPPRREAILADLIEEHPIDVRWRTSADTRRLLRIMSPLNQAKVAAAMRGGRRMVGGVYQRTRRDPRGVKVQRAEVRFDGVAGCLRTPAGGSSRQTILVIDGQAVRSRLISAREAARLMGLPDDYALPASTTTPTASPATASPFPSFDTSLAVSSSRSSGFGRSNAARPTRSYEAAASSDEGVGAQRSFRKSTENESRLQRLGTYDVPSLSSRLRRHRAEVARPERLDPCQGPRDQPPPPRTICW